MLLTVKKFKYSDSMLSKYMEIGQITEQNPWWEDKERINEDDKVKAAASRAHGMAYSFIERNTLITGPRQVGKTTFLKLFIKSLIDRGVDPKRTLYFSCEALRNFDDVLEIVRFSDSLIAGKKYLFFDEITFVEDWQRAIKLVLDSPLSRDKTVYVTGSSSAELKKETFPGRDIRIEHFMPLSFRAFCGVFGSENLRKEIARAEAALSVEELHGTAKKLLFYFGEAEGLFNRYMQCGGFPRSMYESLENHKIPEETYEVYWNWLVSDVAKLGMSERITSSVLLGALKNYGTRFSLNSVAKEMEIGSHVTIRDYLEVLESLFVLRSVFPIDLRKGTEAFGRMRKVYFIDPFLFHVFKKRLAGMETKEEEMPRLVEGIVAEHLIRKFSRTFYYSQKKEVDFYVKNHDCGIEVKWQKRVGKNDFPQVEMKNRMVLSKGTFDFFEGERLLILPVSVFLLML